MEIHLKLIGRFEVAPPEPTPEELKRQDQLRRHRIKSRERYQQIKAGTHTVGELYKLTCKCCGKDFESKHSNALFCGPNCRAKFYIREAAQKRSRECVCGNCGTTFITTRKDVKYCSAACRTEANLIRQRRRNAESRERLKHEKEAAAV